MNSKYPAKIAPAFRRVVTLGLGLSAFAVFAEPQRSSTVIQPPAPPGLPKPPAIRLPNPPGLPEPPSVGSVIRVEKEPPAPRAEEIQVSTRPGPEAVWIPGYWAWRDDQYVWVPGRWERPPQSQSVWVAPRWERRDNGYVFIQGYWR